jgi:hypothetical protein
MNLINISNHPLDNTIKRKAKRANIITDEYNHPSLVYVDFRVLVKHYKEVNGVDVEYPLILDYVFRLRADNSTLVDPATGNYVDEAFYPNAIGEADYFINVIAASNTPIDTISEQIILRADSYQRLNNYGMAQIVTWM